VNEGFGPVAFKDYPESLNHDASRLVNDFKEELIYLICQNILGRGKEKEMC